MKTKQNTHEKTTDTMWSLSSQPYFTTFNYFEDVFSKTENALNSELPSRTLEIILSLSEQDGSNLIEGIVSTEITSSFQFINNK